MKGTWDGMYIGNITLNINGVEIDPSKPNSKLTLTSVRIDGEEVRYPAEKMVWGKLSGNQSLNFFITGSKKEVGRAKHRLAEFLTTNLKGRAYILATTIQFTSPGDMKIFKQHFRTDGSVHWNGKGKKSLRDRTATILGQDTIKVKK